MRLIAAIKVKGVISDLVRLKPRYSENTFEPLLNGKSVTVGGDLIDEKTQKTEYIIIGEVYTNSI